MAVSRLSRVSLRAEPADLDALLTDLIRFGRFHPSHREGLSQDIRLLLVASRAQAVNGPATELYPDPAFAGTREGVGPVPAVRATGVADLLTEFDRSHDAIERVAKLLRDSADRQSVATTLQTIRDSSLALFHAVERVRASREPDGTLAIEGYVPTAELESFRARVGRFLVRSEPVKTRGPDDPYIPTLLVNPRVIALFEEFTLQRGIPKYNEIDPTPVVALVFPLFFGLMFGDVGHGLALLAFGLYLAFRTRFVYWGRLMVVFAVAATAVGLLRGVVFGLTFVSPLARVVHLPPAVSADATFVYVPLLIEAAILIGTLHLTSAYVIALVNEVKSMRYGEALLGALPTLLLYASLVGFGLAVLGTNFQPGTVFHSAQPTPFFEDFLGVYVPVGTVATLTVPVILVSLAVLVAGPSVLAYRSARVRPGRKALRALREGLLRGLSRPSEFFLNTVSYIRLAALLITNTLLAVLIAGTLAYGLPGIVLAAVLNVLVMAMEGLIVYLQDMRLHWFEWLPKFYAGTGTAFRPLRVSGERFSVVWDRAPPLDRTDRQAVGGG